MPRGGGRSKASALRRMCSRQQAAARFAFLPPLSGAGGGDRDVRAQAWRELGTLIFNTSVLNGYNFRSPSPPSAPPVRRGAGARRIPLCPRRVLGKFCHLCTVPLNFTIRIVGPFIRRNVKRYLLSSYTSDARCSSSCLHAHYPYMMIFVEPAFSASFYSGDGRLTPHGAGASTQPKDARL